MSKHPIPSGWNFAIITVQIASFIVLFSFAARTSSWLSLAMFACLFAILGNSIYAIVHEAEHRLLFKNEFWNDFWGVLMTLLFPAAFHLLRQSHLGHHWRNRSDDEAFDYYFDGESPAWKWLQLYGILTGFFWLVVVLSNVAVLCFPFVFHRRFFGFDRPSAAYMDSLSPALWRIIKLEASAAILLHAAIVWLLQISLVNYIAVYLGFGISWSAMQYVHHFGTQRDIVDGTRNLWLCGPIDWIWLHHNWHHTHHQHPTVPWIYLPGISHEQGAQREFLLWHYLRMWRGPRYTNQRVENRYAGRIVR